jgi:hypothetical protein
MLHIVEIRFALGKFQWVHRAAAGMVGRWELSAENIPVLAIQAGLGATRRFEVDEQAQSFAQAFGGVVLV